MNPVIGATRQHVFSVASDAAVVQSPRSPAPGPITVDAEESGSGDCVRDCFDLPHRRVRDDARSAVRDAPPGIGLSCLTATQAGEPVANHAVRVWMVHSCGPARHGSSTLADPTVSREPFRTRVVSCRFLGSSDHECPNHPHVVDIGMIAMLSAPIPYRVCDRIMVVDRYG